MAKYIAPPATADQMLRTIGATQEDLEIVERLLREIGEYDDPPAEGFSGEDSPSPKKIVG